MRIQASGGLSDADIDKMVKDAELHSAEDKERRALAEAKNTAEALVHQTEKALSDLGEGVAAEDKHAAQDAISAVKAALEGSDKAAIETASQKLSTVAMKLGQAAYEKAQTKPDAPAADAPSSSSTTAAAEGEVLDAEYTEDDTKKSA